MNTSLDHFVSVLGALDLLPHLLKVAALVVGICLGWIFKREANLRKEAVAKSGESTKSDAPPAEEESSSSKKADVSNNHDSELSKLSGELAAAKSFKTEQTVEMERLKSRITALRSELSNRDRALDSLMSGVSGDASDVDKKTSTAQQATNQISEALSLEANRCELQASEMKRLSAKLSSQNDTLLKEADALSELRERVEKTGKAGAVVKRLEVVEQEIRTLHQNTEGATERLGETRERLQIRGRSLEMARDAALAERDDDDPKETLLAMRESLDEMEPGVNQLVAETLDRVDYVVKDSPSAFAKTVDTLSINESEEKEGEVGVSMLMSQACRRLTEVRGTLEGTELALENVRREFSSPIRSRKKWLKTIDGQIKEVDSAPETASSNSPEEGEVENISEISTEEPSIALLPDPVPEFDPQSELVETLETDLVDARKEIEDLKTQLAAASSAPTESSEHEEPKRKKKPSAPAPGRNIPLIRRMLNLAGGGDTAAIEPLGLAGSALAGIGASSLPPQSIFEARKALHSLKLAGKNDHLELPLEDTDEAEDTSESPQSEEIFSLVSEDPSEDFAGFPMPTGGAVSRVDEMAETIETQRRRIDELETELRDLRITPLTTGSALSAKTEIPDEGPAPILNFSPSGGPIDGYLVRYGSAEKLIFRSRDPRFWDTATQDQNGNFALELSEETVPSGMSYLRIRRTDTGESMVFPMTRDELLSEQNLTRNGESATCGWSGKGEFYFGSGHLGIFDESLPREVEVRFGAGGWGFGHASQIATEQALSWAGKPISNPGAQIEIRIGEQPVAASAEEEDLDGITAPIVSPFSGKDTEAIILYRSNDPSLWNTTHYSAANRRSLALYDLSATISWVRVRRMDTGEAVLLPATNEILLDDGSGQRSSIGFNGSGEHFYGSIHFGIYDEALPQGVETRFSYGGWGYGHDHSPDEQQAVAWAGEKIPSDTVIEIAVFREMPPVGEKDQVLALERG